MVLELAGGCAFDGPVAGIVHPGCGLVGEQSAAAHEELNVEDPLVAEVLKHAPQVGGGASLERRRMPWCARQPQDAFAVQVVVERIDRHFALPVADTDDRHLEVEGHEFFVDERRRPQGLEGGRGICRAAHYGLALAVVAEPPGLQHPRQADVAQCTDE